MIQLYDSKSGKVRDFNPIDPTDVRMYVCGPTVYSTPHIGNARPAIVFDLLYRLLRNEYGELAVRYVSNFTDVDDKIIAIANSTNQTIESVTERSIGEYERDMSALNILPPNQRTFATKYIGEMIDMITDLIDRNHAYVGSDGDVLFEVATNPYEGLEPNRSDTRTRLEETDKRDSKDFVLWKMAKPGEPFWESPWGNGRPGWHIECSAMIRAALGKTIDIHGGGLDLKFPHHEAETAQSQCANGEPLANYWMHNGLITMNKQKMAKSVGNIMLLSTMLEQYSGEVIRLWFLKTHYREALELTSLDDLKPFEIMIDKWYRLLFKYSHVRINPDVPVNGIFLGSLHRDMNTSQAIQTLNYMSQLVVDGSELEDNLSKFVKAANLLGLLTKDPVEWFQGVDNKPQIEDLILVRNQARADKDWAGSDRIRIKLLDEYGVLVEDTKNETFWFKKERR